MEDTIVAIATPLGVGAISIIRVSGTEAIKIVNKIFSNNNLHKVKSHTINYGFIVENNEKIDEVLISVMKAPKTYTKEDIIEINCHGGIATTNKVLELLIENGCRLAEPGEFTKRAFLNGRIDLTEAEGIMNLINSKTETARKLFINQLSGRVSNKIEKIRQDIIEVLANIEVNIDYPEYEDIEKMTLEMLKPRIEELKKTIRKVLDESKNGKIIKEGIQTAIIGRPNVGKSSILNALIEEDKAIVTDIAGTTRDIVEGQINLDGILLNFIDTAGIRETTDIVESIGVNKSKEIINKADLILFVLNNNNEIHEEDIKILENLKNKNYIIIINKIDLESKIDINLIKEEKVIEMSILNNIGIEELKQEILKIFNLNKLELNDLTYLSSSRSIAILKQINSTILDIEKAIDLQLPIDMIEIDLKEIWNKLGEIIGKSYENELIDQLFSQFCLGK
ncbi:MAG: tRNA uridine-5-carboxymethylaminomethyl(34) synthesis GTPase MnmE [Bacilli bacterium]|nr:tRNA uridine-5-carboxymethylaminomethyl(34) synthesis GTPase MnmE [Bacilli bacterium]